MERDTEIENKALGASIDLGTTDDVQEYMLEVGGEMDADGEIDIALNALDTSTAIDGSDAADTSTPNTAIGLVASTSKVRLIRRPCIGGVL